MTVADLDSDHIVERLGLLYIIVLGEVVSQLVLTSADLHWTPEGVAIAVAGALLVTLLWAETFASGLTGGAVNSADPVAARHMLPVPLWNSLGVVVTAAGLGLLLEGAQHPVDPPVQIMVFGGLALHISANAVIGMSMGGSIRWLVRIAIPVVLLTALTVIPWVTDRTMHPVAIAWIAALSMLLPALPGAYRPQRQVAG